MTLPRELTKRFRLIQERGDVETIKKLLRCKRHSSASLILSGKISTTIAKIEKIKRFIEDREKIVSALTEPGRR